MSVRYETTPLRVVRAVAFGSAAGGLSIALETVGPMIGQWGPATPASFLIALTVASIAFALGITLLAGPVWMALHRAGARGWLWAFFLGAGLGFMVPILLREALGLLPGYLGSSGGDGGGITEVEGRLTAHGWTELLQESALLAADCAAIGLLIWRIAYRRSTVARMGVSGGSEIAHEI